MTNSITAVKSTLILLLFLLCLPLQAQSGRVDWEEAGQVTLAEMPIDIARSQDAEYTFVLTAKGKVYIYGKDGSLAGEISVEPSVSKIAVSPKGDQLYLLSEKNKSLKTINLSFIEEINIAGSPFLGAADARVSVVVFSDFQ